MKNVPSGDRRIYVASLAAYNAGKLHGVWIDLDGAEEDAVYEQIKAMMVACPEGGEEYEVHDSEGFGPLLRVTGSVEDALKHSALIEEHGNAWVAYVESVGMQYATPEHFEEAYQGEWNSFKDFAMDLADGCGYASSAANAADRNPLLYYIDWDAWTRDMEQDYNYENLDGTCYVFDRNV